MQALDIDCISNRSSTAISITTATDIEVRMLVITNANTHSARLNSV